MRLVNIMTYEEAEIFPGPQLNVVLGPNGTGKSSIVCGMVLGFGGKPAFLGRGKEISDFIRKGTDQAIIEIEVYGGEKKKNLVITRTMKKDNTSTWKLNGKPSAQNLVKEAVERLNVQVENLCSFLPQDRVSSFSELDPAALLRETELAIDGEPLTKQHDLLVELRKTEKSLNLVITETEKEASNQQLQNQAVERDVIRFQEREKMIAKIADLNKKRPWLEFEQKREEGVQAQQRLVAAKKELAQAETRILPLKDRVAAQKKILADAEAETIKIKDSLKTLDLKRTTTAQELDKAGEKTEALLEAKEESIRQERERELKLEAATLKVAKAEEHLEIARRAAAEADTSSRTVTANIDVLRRELGDLQAQINEAGYRSGSIRTEVASAEQKVRSFDQTVNSRLQSLQQGQMDVVRMHAYIQEHKSSFRDRVFGPVSMEINVPNRSEANQLETALPDWLRLAFIVQNDDDSRYLSELRVKNKWHINVVTLDVSKIRPIPDHRELTPQQMKQHGLQKWLDETFDTPAWPVLKDFIVQQANLNQIAVRSTDDDRWDYPAVPLKMFFSKSKIYTSTTSRYGNRDKSTTVRLIKDARYMAGVDQEGKRRAHQELESKKAEFEAAMAAGKELEPLKDEKTRELQQLRAQQDGLAGVRKKVLSMETILTRARAELKDIQNSDETRKRAQIDAELKKLTLRRFELNVQLEKVTRQVIEDALKQSGNAIRKMGARRLLEELEMVLATFQGEFETLKARVAQLETELYRIKSLLRTMRDKAESIAPLEDHKELFATLPATIEELDAEIDLLQARATAIIPNPEIVKRYEERRKNIEKLGNKLNHARAQLDRTIHQKQQVLAEWLPRVKEIAGSIDKNFKEFFSNMGCQGAVHLHEDETEDFEKYGIEILVSYRPTEPLQQLAASRQSGGEKSVATMLYLVSLQQLSDCPFRLVDEINQGMDPKNERMIFEQVTMQATKPNTPQYFLITPKLLADLFFQKNCTVLTVCNGPWQTPQKQMNVAFGSVFGSTAPHAASKA